MPSFSIASGSSTTFIDATPGTGLVIDFDSLDNSFNVQINGVNLFVGGPGGAPNELEFQTSGTSGQTVRFADGDQYGTNTQEIYQLGNTNGEPVVRLEINPDGTITLFGVKVANGPLEPLEVFNGLSVNTAAIDAAWNNSGSNSVVVDQVLTGPTNASGDVEDVPCFALGTLIDTFQGLVRIEDLRATDRVLTYDNGYKPIRWIGSCRVSHAQLQTSPNLKPILIRADALGMGYPKQDLIVSPQHRILLSSPIAKRMFGCQNVLVPAKKLLPLHGVETIECNLDGVEYWHILFDDHEVVWSNGAPTESLYTGPEALKSISREAFEEIRALFPEICELDFKPISACYIPEKGRLVKQLVQRHQKNNTPIYCKLYA
jgi:hypothetical protein